MSLPTLPTSEHDLIIPLPDQSTRDSRLHHLQGQAYRRQQQQPSGLVVDPIDLLRCISGSDSSFPPQTTFVDSRPTQHAVTVVTSSAVFQEPVFSVSSASEDEVHTHSETHSHASHTASSHEGSRVVEHFEVDPHARGVLAFRRNSMRKFATVVEETGEKEPISHTAQQGRHQSSFTTPLFVISDGIRKIYFPGQNQVPKKQEEIENKVTTYEQISFPKYLRRIQSHPELSSLGEPNLPSNYHKPISVNSSNLGSVSIFSSFAGELRSQVHVKHNPSSQSAVAVPGSQFAVAHPEKKTVSQSEKESHKKQKPQSQSPAIRPGKVEVADVKLPEIAHEKPKKDSFMKSVLKWGTETKVKVSDKETNMFSPASF